MLSLDGSKMVSTPNGKNLVRVSNLETGDKVWEKTHEGIIAARFHPDDSQIITSSPNRVIIWDAKTGEQVKEFYHDHGACVAEFSPNGSKVVLSNFIDPNVAIYNSENFSYICSIPGVEISSQAFTKDESQVVVFLVREERGVAQVWKLTKDACLTTTIRHEHEPMPSDYSRPEALNVHIAKMLDDGRFILTVNAVGEVQISCGRLGTKKMTLNVSRIAGLQVSPDGKNIVTVSNMGEIRIWKLLISGTEITVSLDAYLSSSSKRIYRDGSWRYTLLPSFSKNMQNVVITGRNKLTDRWESYVWDLYSRECIFILEHERDAHPEFVGFSLVGSKLISDADSTVNAQDSSDVSVWNVDLHLPRVYLEKYDSPTLMERITSFLSKCATACAKFARNNRLILLLFCICGTIICFMLVDFLVFLVV